MIKELAMHVKKSYNFPYITHFKHKPDCSIWRTPTTSAGGQQYLWSRRQCLTWTGRRSSFLDGSMQVASWRRTRTLRTREWKASVGLRVWGKIQCIVFYFSSTSDCQACIVYQWGCGKEEASLSEVCGALRPDEDGYWGQWSRSKCGITVICGNRSERQRFRLPGKVQQGCKENNFFC